MLHRIHDKLGTAGLVIAIVALVAALAGTAFAAVPGLNSKQKKEVKKIAAKVVKVGPQGPQGPQGAQGSQGSKGDAGAAGSNGTNGTNGTNGEPGVCSPSNPECAAPAGATFTGDWAFATAGHSAYVVIDFPLRLSGEPASHWLGKKTYAERNTACEAETEPEKATCLADLKALEEDCPGTASNPQAAPGNLCIYALELANVNQQPNFVGASTADPRSGWVGEFVPTSGEGYGYGSWAVTAN